MTYVIIPLTPKGHKVAYGRFLHGIGKGLAYQVMGVGSMNQAIRSFKAREEAPQ